MPNYVPQELTNDMVRSMRLDCGSNYICGKDLYAIAVYVILLLIIALFLVNKWGFGRKLIVTLTFISLGLYFIFGAVDTYAISGWGWGGRFFEIGLSLIYQFTPF